MYKRQEEEIQRRIKKGKTGVPFDTGFVVTGRYDLSATSEIGLKAGLTEEQKKLFSYFVPVRGMSEQIVEVLDNDRREQREGTSRVGNILVIGQKGSGTVSYTHLFQDLTEMATQMVHLVVTVVITIILQLRVNQVLNAAIRIEPFMQSM